MNLRLSIAVLVALAALAAPPAFGRVAWSGCDSSLPASSELRCATLSVSHAGELRRFLSSHRSAGTARSRSRLTAAATWLEATFRPRIAEARARMLPPVDVAAWLPTVRCENGGRWADSPGYFLGGLQFDPGTWRTAASHTGLWDLSPRSQVVNAIWTATHATVDPWPNCPDPYFG